MLERPEFSYREALRDVSDGDDVGLVGGHLAARRMQRRVLMICSVLGIMGVTMLAGAVVWSDPGVPSLSRLDRS